MSDTIWMIFGFRECESSIPGRPHVQELRYHIGPFNETVQRQVVSSIRKSAAKDNLLVDWIEAVPLKNEPTTHGHQRWPHRYGYEEILYVRRGFTFTHHYEQIPSQES